MRFVGPIYRGQQRIERTRDLAGYRKLAALMFGPTSAALTYLDWLIERAGLDAVLDGDDNVVLALLHTIHFNPEVLQCCDTSTWRSS